jgi:CheY-like chemotaxis protein
MEAPSGLLLVDDDLENVRIAVEILSETLGEPVEAVDSVERAVERLHDRAWRAVVMDVFIPLGDDPARVLGPRGKRVEAQVEHLGGLVLLDEIDRLDPPPLVLAHTACTDRVLLDIFEGRVAHRIPKPAPLDTLLRDIMDALDAHG